MASKNVVTGHREIDRKMAQLETKVQNRIARDELKKSTKKLVIVAKNNLQAHGNVESGDLLRSIKDRAMPRSRSRIGRIVLTIAKGSGKAAFGGADIELGSKNNEQQSFMRKAGYENERYVRGEIVSGIKSTLRSMKKLT